MASIEFDDIYSRFYTKVEAYDLLFENMSDEMADEFMEAWLRSAIFYPYIRRVFSEVSADTNRAVVTYTMRYPTDELSDAEFVTELLAYGVVHSWLEPKVRSITNVVQMFGTSDEKYFSQASHLNELRALLSDVEIKIRALIADRGYLNNSYLDGGANK